MKCLADQSQDEDEIESEDNSSFLEAWRQTDHWVETAAGRY